MSYLTGIVSTGELVSAVRGARDAAIRRIVADALQVRPVNGSFVGRLSGCRVSEGRGGGVPGSVAFSAPQVWLCRDPRIPACARLKPLFHDHIHC